MPQSDIIWGSDHRGGERASPAAPGAPRLFTPPAAQPGPQPHPAPGIGAPTFSKVLWKIGAGFLTSHTVVPFPDAYSGVSRATLILEMLGGVSPPSWAQLLSLKASIN